MRGAIMGGASPQRATMAAEAGGEGGGEGFMRVLESAVQLTLQAL